MDAMDKLKILTMAAKYDVACTSSGSSRGGQRGSLGNTVAAGICHSFSADGRCISLLKVLMTNYCIFNCQYCVNRKDNDIPRAAFTPEEIGELTLNFYKRNYIEGLFLSSAVINSPDYTMELLYKSLYIVRHQYRFNGYIHVKAIPGADPRLISLTAQLADRMSVNIELPSQQSLEKLAPDKNKETILKPMRVLKQGIVQSKNEIKLYKHAPKFAPAGQSTQMIVGATKDSDKQIVRLAEKLYQKYSLKRVFYSAYIPVSQTNGLPVKPPPLLREHRLYQADWLMRFYGFEADEILGNQEDLSLEMDPKCLYAINNLGVFPIEINRDDYEMILKVPGIGVRSAERIIQARRVAKLDFPDLKKMGVVLKRAKYFITCKGKMYARYPVSQEFLHYKLMEKGAFEQVSLFEKPELLLPTKEDGVKCLTGEI